MSNVITKRHAPEDPVAEVIPTQGQYEILHAEPRYKVDQVREEIKGRRGRVLLEMREAITGLLIGLMERIEQAATEENIPKGHVAKVDFLDVRWTQEGRLVMLLGPGGRRSYDPECHREGIDELVEEVVTRIFPASRRPMPYEVPESLAALATSVVEQFAAASKHDPALEMRKVRFERIRWRDDELTVDITHDGRPLRPLEARFW